MLITIWWLQKFEKDYLRKLNELEVRTKYQIKNSKRFVALEKFSDCEDIELGVGEH
jgi:hypothetical protein